VESDADRRLGKRVKRPSAIIFFAPEMVSSAGWPISIRVPCQVCLLWAMMSAVATSAAMWRSWPQACITGRRVRSRLWHGLCWRREAGFFLDGKGVEFGAEHDGRAGSVLEDGDNAGAADCFVTS